MSAQETIVDATREDFLPERLRAISYAEAAALRRWFQRLTLSSQALATVTEAPPYPRVARAQLRRCALVEAALLTEGFRLLWSQLPEPTDKTSLDGDTRLEAWACTAAIVADLRYETVGVPLGKRLGGQKEDTGKPRVSELRFQQLLDCRNAPELMQRLRRVLALADREGVSAVYLADNIVHWWRSRASTYRARATNQLGFIWSSDYFAARSAYTDSN